MMGTQRERAPISIISFTSLNGNARAYSKSKAYVNLKKKQQNLAKFNGNWLLLHMNILMSQFSYTKQIRRISRDDLMVIYCSVPFTCVVVAFFLLFACIFMDKLAVRNKDVDYLLMLIKMCGTIFHLKWWPNGLQTDHF